MASKGRKVRICSFNCCSNLYEWLLFLKARILLLIYTSLRTNRTVYHVHVICEQRNLLFPSQFYLLSVISLDK